MLDKKYNFKENDAKWEKFWQENGTYKYDENSAKPTYSIDTPPPTVSGSLHIGHISGFTQADMLARFRRMQGYNMFYPLGFDNNGLPTELLVEKERKLQAHAMPREEFTKIALEVVDKYNQEYRNMMTRVGMSCDLTLGYNTIDNRSQATSQKSFIDLAKRGIAYQDDKPAPWCSKCRTSVASLELESKDIDSMFNYLNFNLADGGTIPIATTRPEFLPACVAVLVNPEDERYKHLVGKLVKVPLFEDRTVKIYADEKVGIDKGTGIVMCCTFGDQTDVEWWKKFNLELRQAIDDGGRMTEICGKYAGLKTTEARAQIIEDLKQAGYIYRQDPICHAVQVHERCDTPIEFLPKKQWFIKTSSEELKKIWLQQGEKIEWHPEAMKTRYDVWVNNLNQDWSISRQRYFGVPFPVWYCKACGKPKFAEIEDLPVNPLTTNPKTCCECGCCDFIPEKDVLDTWATSSCTPQINMNWLKDEKYANEHIPMSMRFCGRDIITTWSLRTIIKAYYHQNTIPWKTLNVNGWVMADKGIKISKHLANSKMNLNDLLNNCGADVIRYWCASGAYGRDVYFSDDGLKDGAKLSNKLWNASKFALSFLYDYTPEKPENVLPMDLYIMAKYNQMFEEYTKQLEISEMGYAKAELEKFFWDFCDNYIEIAKNRLYKPEVYGTEAKKSAQWATYNVLLGILKCFAIFMPHITEEIYQDYFVNFEKTPSIHNTILGKIKMCEKCDDTCKQNLIKNGDLVCEIVSNIRGYKSENKVSLKTVVKNLEITSNSTEFIKSCEYDIKAVGSVENITYQSGEFNLSYGELVVEE